MSGEIDTTRPVEGLALLRLCAPERKNAFTGELARELTAELRRLDDDPDIGAIVLSGGPEAFCAGAHRELLRDAGRGDAAALSDLQAVYGVFSTLWDLTLPTVAAVCGAAVGAGLNLALACDVRMLGDNAYLRSMFVANSIHPAGGNLRMLVELGGRELATLMSVLDRPLRGAEAAAAGLGLGPFPAADLEQEALSLAAGAAANPGLSRRMMASLEAVAELPLEMAAALEAKAQEETLRARERPT